MAYKMSDVGGFGTGALGDISNPSGQINSYANVTAISTNTVTIGTASAGIYETFAVGKEILLHVSAVLSGTDATKLGKYLVATITGVSGSVLTLSKDVAANLVANADLTTLVVQAITVAQFGTLTLSSGSITPPAYSTTNKYGGVIALKCKTGLIFSGGSISLVDKGIPTASSALRPLTAQETEMTTGNKKTTGWENHITSRQALMNCGDGVAMIWAKNTTISSSASRIGGTTAGVKYYPYVAANEYSIRPNTPAAVLGGSTILLASETISPVSLSVGLISKGKGSGTGYGRCYIATETALPNDEGLYAQDCLSNPARLRDFGIKDYGTGALGDITNPTGQLSSYAPVSAISGNQITIGTISAGIFETFAAGTEVMFHVSAMKTASDNSQFGKFYLAKVLAVSGSVVTLDTPPPWTVSLTDYSCQLITVPNFNNLTISTTYSAAKKWDNTAKIGGILVIKSKGTFDLSSGKLNMEGKGLLDANNAGNATLRPYISTQCSGQQKDYLPMNQGVGSVLIIANEMIANTSSRICGLSSGAEFGGAGPGADTTVVPGGGHGHKNQPYEGTYAFGGFPNTGVTYTGSGIGLKGNTGGSPPVLGGDSGGSIMIIADTLVFNLCMISTGGLKGSGGYQQTHDGFPGGAGYGGGGSDRGGGGAGTCFIYANNVTVTDYTGVVI